jgi:hypothetical protein
MVPSIAGPAENAKVVASFVLFQKKEENDVDLRDPETTRFCGQESPKQQEKRERAKSCNSSF